jgi:hypothetical protein
MKKIILIIIILTTKFVVIAQVGINSIPKSGSILDLSNNNNKYLVLPKTNNPDTIKQDTASVIYHNDNLYFNTNNGIKVLSPWKWDGNSLHSISSPIGATVGIGIVPISFTPFRMQVNNVFHDVTDSTNYASLLIGEQDSVHMLIDNNEIMAKTNQNNSGVLKLQEEKGDVTIGSPFSIDTMNNVLTVYGSTDSKGKVKERGNELLPAGSIIMWSGSTIPNGWALCDGGIYPREDGTGNISTPNLINRFIVGADPGGTGTYAIGDTGGVATDNHTHDFDPNSFTNSFSGEHNHTAAITSPLRLGQEGIFCDDINAAGSNHTHTITANEGAHNHTFNLPATTSLVNIINENRPPFYTLAFII